MSVFGFKTKDEYLRTVHELKDNFPKGSKLHVMAAIEEGNSVSAEVESMGEHLSGKHYNNRYHFLFEIMGDKIVSVKEYMDMLQLYDLLEPKERKVN